MTETTTWAAGCFWGIEAAFRRLDGVTSTRVGYTGGTTSNPTYRQVCGKRTGHAEAVEVQHDPELISYQELLEAFWAMHDPTTRNRQGFDIGSQYRSAIYTHSPEQQQAAERSRDEHGTELGRTLLGRQRRIVTEIVPAEHFWPAEEYHQRYLEKQGRASCVPALRAS